MKKCLLLLVGAIVALATHAQLYVVGNSVAGDFTSALQQKYDAPSALEASQVGDYYCFRASGEFQLSTKRAGWDDGWKTNSVGIGGWQGDGDVRTSTCTRPGSETKLNPPVGWGETYFRVKTDLSEIQASKNSEFGSTVVPSTTSYKLHGQLTTGSWTTVDMVPNGDNWEYTGNLVAGDFGLQVYTGGENTGWIGGSANVTEANVVYDFSGNNDSNSSLVGEYTIVYNPAAKTIEFKADVKDVYTYALYKGDTKLYDFTGSNPYEVNFTISTPLEADTPLCVKRVKNGSVDTTYGLANGVTYDGTGLDNAALQQDGADLVLAAALEGAVTFTLNVTDNVPSSLSVAGGQLHQTEFKAFYLIGEFNNWSQKDDRYKFETTDGKVYTYNAVDKIDGTDGWKINDGTWDLDFARNPQDPHVEYNVVYELKKNTGTDGNFEREIPAGAKITFTYNENGTSTLLITTEGGGDTPVNKPTTLYIQMKYDYATQAADAPKTETEPITNPVRCHIYNSVTKEAKYEFGSDAEKMTRESFRYSLWKYDITEEDVEKYDAVDFYIYTTKDNGTYANPIEYHSNIAVYTQDGRDYEADVMWYDKENWTQFIYATATLAKHSPNDANPSRYACQSMLSYEDFNALNERDAANGGRSALYLVGWGVKFDAEDAEGNLIEEGKSLPGTPAESYPLPADNGCFYLPVHKPGSGDAGKFKVSFVNVGSASEHMSRFGAKAKALADSYDENSLGCPRHWATFDLGLVGVDTRFDYTKFDGAWQPTYASGEAGSPGSVNMVVNRSVKYNNVNQGDWLIPTDTPKGLNYFVFDSHNECMSVSLIDFDPNPSIVANSCDVQTAQLSSDEAINLHDLGLRLDGSAVNGQVYVQNVNYVHGNVTIKAADGNNLSDDGRYSSSYSLLLDGRELGSSTGAVAGTYDIEFLPVSADCNIQIRGTYTNNRNKLTFHSRTSKASLSTEVVLAAPAAVDCDGQYVVNKNIEADGDVYTYGVFVKDGLAFRMDGDTDRYYYADLAVEGAEIIDSKHYIASYDLSPGMDGWVKNLGAEGSDWFENGEDNDWSSIMKSGVNVPVYLPAVATAADVKTLEAQTIEGEIKAVYPFIIDPEAKLTPAASQAPNRAVSNGIAGEISTAGKVMSYVPVSAPVTINVTNDNVISGVADVAADKTAEGDTEYYTISGVRVIGAPAPGIYIRRQGDSVSKVVVR